MLSSSVEITFSFVWFHRVLKTQLPRLLMYLKFDPRQTLLKSKTYKIFGQDSLLVFNLDWTWQKCTLTFIVTGNWWVVPGKKKSWTSYFYTMMLQMAIFLLNWHSKYLIIWYVYFIQWVVGIKRLLGLGLWVNFMKNENVAKCAWFFLLVKNKIHSSLYTLL